MFCAKLCRRARTMLASVVYCTLWYWMWADIGSGDWCWKVPIQAAAKAAVGVAQIRYIGSIGPAPLHRVPLPGSQPASGAPTILLHAKKVPSDKWAGVASERAREELFFAGDMRPNRPGGYSLYPALSCTLWPTETPRWAVRLNGGPEYQQSEC